MSLRSRGFFDIDGKIRRNQEIEALSSDGDFWTTNPEAKVILRERAAIQQALGDYKKISGLLDDAKAAFELGQDTSDKGLLAECDSLLIETDKLTAHQEFLFKMKGEYDRTNAILEINSGSGGTEAQDWADMLLRMYVRWAERKGFTLEELDYQAGEGAGIKSAAYLITGPYAYGHLRSEQGVHRLVRISPFDSNARRHTSFASVAVTPDIEEEINIEINEKELKIDTYRAGGKGGQHVNRTDSAVRLTHLPTGIVVACQSERSQHKNRDRAMKMLKSKLHELYKNQQSQKMEEIKGVRLESAFGSQIRSYVLQPYQMIKDLRTDCETSDVKGVLDGEIDQFIEAYLLSAK